MIVHRRWWPAIVVLLVAILRSWTSVAGGPLPDRVVVLTFDDASHSHATFVSPLLKKHGFGATFLICEFPPDFATDKPGDAFPACLQNVIVAPDT